MRWTRSKAWGSNAEMRTRSRYVEVRVWSVRVCTVCYSTTFLREQTPFSADNNNNNNNSILVKFPIPKSSMALSICPNRTVASVLKRHRLPIHVSQETSAENTYRTRILSQICRKVIDPPRPPRRIAEAKDIYWSSSPVDVYCTSWELYSSATKTQVWKMLRTV